MQIDINIVYVKEIYFSESIYIIKTFKNEKMYRRFAKKHNLHTGERMNPLNEEECVWKFKLIHSAN